MTSLRYRRCRTKRPRPSLRAGEDQVKCEGYEDDSLEADFLAEDAPGPYDQPIDDLVAQLQGLQIKIQTHALAVQARL